MTELPALHHTLVQLAATLKQRGWMMATAESCTGGLIAAACTDLPGSSDWFDRGFVTYSNAAKTEMLGVPPALIETHGAVSEAVVRTMAEAAVQRSNACVAVAVSGVAGPGGGSADKPVGTVWMAWTIGPTTHAQCRQFVGDRAAVRAQVVAYVQSQLLHWVNATSA